MDKDYIAALDRDARESESIVHRMHSEAYLARGLVNAYRDGKPVLIDEGAEDQVAIAISGAPFASAQSKSKARRVLSALGVK